jgi:hypothetical protein
MNTFNKRRTISAPLIAAIVIMLLPAGSQFFVSPAEAQVSTPPYTSPTVGNFSLIWITDTQYLSQIYPTYFDAMCRWIVNNAAAYNVKMVVHTGDIVDSEDNQTQWANANHSISILLDAGIPYCWNAGNHDYTATYWMGNQYIAFNPAVLAEKPYWVGDEFNGQNTAIHVNVSGWDLLVVNLENLANNTALEWANSVLDSYPDSHAIVATHAYLNNQGGYAYRKSEQDSSWASNLNATVLETHSSVFLTLNGHFNTNNGKRTQVGDRAELMFDRQDQDGSLGGATLRILTFDTANNTITVKTFVLYANSFLTDTNDQFTLSTSFYNVYATGVPEFSVTAVLVFLLASSAAILVCRSRFLKRNIH